MKKNLLFPLMMLMLAVLILTACTGTQDVLGNEAVEEEGPKEWRQRIIAPSPKPSYVIVDTDDTRMIVVDPMDEGKIWMVHGHTAQIITNDPLLVDIPAVLGEDDLCFVIVLEGPLTEVRFISVGDFYLLIDDEFDAETYAGWIKDDEECTGGVKIWTYE